jgi:hypothetical protein
LTGWAVGYACSFGMDLVCAGGLRESSTLGSQHGLSTAQKSSKGPKFSRRTFVAISTCIRITLDQAVRHSVPSGRMELLACCDAQDFFLDHCCRVDERVDGSQSLTENLAKFAHPC